MKWVVVFLLATTSCGPQSKGSQEQRYHNAVLTFRHGELAQALDQARSESKRALPDSAYCWKFRLLEAEVLRYQGNPSAAAAILAKRVPETPEFADIEARRKMLLSSLPSNQPKEEKRKPFSRPKRLATSTCFWMRKFSRDTICRRMTRNRRVGFSSMPCSALSASRIHFTKRWLSMTWGC